MNSTQNTLQMPAAEDDGVPISEQELDLQSPILRLAGKVPCLNGIPAPAIDPETGDLSVVWEDVRFTGQDETVITRSTNGGATWSSPKRVNAPGSPAFTPVVAVTDSGRDGVAGTVGVTYHRLGASLGLSPTTYFIKRFSAVAAGDSSSVDTGVAANTVCGPFNMLDAPLARDYSSATTSPC